LADVSRNPWLMKRATWSSATWPGKSARPLQRTLCEKSEGRHGEDERICGDPLLSVLILS